MRIGTSREIAQPTRLNTVLVNYLSPNDFVQIGEDIGMDTDDIYGDKAPMARKILQYAQRYGKLIKLFVAITNLYNDNLTQEDLKPYYGTLYLPYTYRDIESMRALGKRTNFIDYDGMLVGGMGWNAPSSNIDVIKEQCWEIYIIYQELGTHYDMVRVSFLEVDRQDLIALNWL